MGKWSTTHNIPSFRKTTTPFNAIELQMEGWTGGRDKVDCTKDWGREWHYWHYTYSAGWCLGPQNYLKSKVQDDVHLLDMQRGWCWVGSQGPGMLHQLGMLPDDDLHTTNGQPLKNHPTHLGWERNTSQALSRKALLNLLVHDNLLLLQSSVY